MNHAFGLLATCQTSVKKINGKTDNNRFILFSIPATDRNMAALPSLLSPQFSHRSPIVLPFQKEN